jgi:hypothetical protein
MKSDNLHLFTEVFPAISAVRAGATGLSRPDGIDVSGFFVNSSYFVTRDTGENQIPVALSPHFGICSANSTEEDREVDMAWRDNRFLSVFPQHQLLRFGQQ